MTLIDVMPKYKLKEEPFYKVILRDVQTGKTGKWPFQKSVDQIVFEQHFLDKVVDIENGCYYPKRDEEGKAIKTTDANNTPKYTVNTIIRLKRKDKKTL